MEKIFNVNQNQAKIDEFDFGNAKIKIGDNFLGPNIEKISKNVYKDKNGNKYYKNGIQKNLLIKYLNKENEMNIFKLKGFHEGSYGIWLEQSPPYFIKDGNLVGKYEKKKAILEDVKSELGNEWIEKEERIKEDFLWIMAGEEIIFPEGKTEDASEEVEKNDVERLSEKENFQFNKEEIEKKDSEKSMALKSQIKSSSSSNSSNGDFFLVSGAKLKCNFGDKNALLTVVPINKVFILNKAMATIMDYKPMLNIAPFGMCKCIANPIVAAATAANHGKLKKMPCIPNTAAPWMNPKLRVTVKNKASITEKSQLVCMWGGMIKVTDAGQNKVKG